jgi:hypothetical protein
MAKIRTHCEDCESLLGEDFREVHEWLDRDASKYPTWLYFEKHRKKTHTMAELQHFNTQEEKLAAKIHIVRDVEQYVLMKAFYRVSLDEIDGLFFRALEYI